MPQPLPSSSGHVSKENRVILVLGPTGAGKSTFINIATGRDSSPVNHGVRSCTSDINPVTMRGPDGHPLVFIDTPGFDDTSQSDGNIWFTISKWLADGYGEHAKLVGILYLHRITDPRVNRPGANNLHVLISLCGMSEMPNVVLVTTFWGQIESHVGEQREEELKGGFWKQMLEQGCGVVRFDGGPESAFDIVKPLLSNERVKSVPSGSEESSDGELKRLERENKNASNRHRELMNQPRLTPEVQAEVEKMEKKILITSIQLRISGSPLVQWLRRVFKRK